MAEPGDARRTHPDDAGKERDGAEDDEQPAQLLHE